MWLLPALTRIHSPELQVSFLLVEPFYLWPLTDVVKIFSHGGIQLCTLFKVCSGYLSPVKGPAIVDFLWVCKIFRAHVLLSVYLSQCPWVESGKLRDVLLSATMPF